MHLRHRTLALGLLAALALAGLAAAAGLPTYTLRLHRGQGDKATYEFTSVSTDRMSGPGVPAGAISSKAQLTCAIEFQGDSPGGRIVIQAKVKEGLVKGTVAGKSQTIPVKTSLATYVLTPRSEVKQSELTSGSPPAISLAGTEFTADDAFLPPPLPDKPVRVGDRWQSSARIPATTGDPTGVREVSCSSRVLGEMTYAGRSCLKIRTSLRQSQRGSLKAPDGSGTATGSGQDRSDITWLFDPKAGLVMKSDAVGTITTVTRLKMAGQPERVLKRSGTIRTHARMVAYNGKPLAAPSAPSRVKRR